MQRQPHVLLAVASAFFFVLTADLLLAGEWAYALLVLVLGGLATAAAMASWRKASRRVEAVGSQSAKGPLRT